MTSNVKSYTRHNIEPRHPQHSHPRSDTSTKIITLLRNTKYQPPISEKDEGHKKKKKTGRFPKKAIRQSPTRMCHHRRREVAD